jgi:hypothetical protein
LEAKSRQAEQPILVSRDQALQPLEATHEIRFGKHISVLIKNWEINTFFRLRLKSSIARDFERLQSKMY